MKKVFLIMSFLSMLNSYIHSQDVWTRTNGIEGGEVLRLVKNSLGVIFASCMSSGLFYSTDNGSSWKATSYVGTLSSICVNKNNDLIISSAGVIKKSSDNGLTWSIVGSGRLSTSNDYLFFLHNNSLIDVTNDGVYKSDDSGQTFVKISGQIKGRVESAAENSRGFLYVADNDGLFMSKDQGVNWQQTANVIGSTGISSIFIDNADKIFISTYGKGIYVSSDDGTTWSNLINLTEVYITCVKKSTFGTLFASSSFGDLFVSYDNGNQWSKMYLTSPQTIIRDMLFFENITTIILATGRGIQISKDNGNYFLSSNRGLVASDIRALVADKNSNIYCGTFNLGIYITKDKGQTWSNISNGIPEGIISTLCSNSNNQVFAGTSLGFFAYDGYQWYPRNSGLISYADIRCMSINNKNTIFIGTANNGVFRSSDDGMSWIRLNNGLNDLTIFSILSVSDSLVFVGTRGEGIYKSVDSGNTWIKVSEGTYVYSLAFSAQNKKIFAVHDGMLYSSVNYGTTWNSSQVGITSTVSTILVLPDGTCFANAPYSFIYRSKDGGQTWSEYDAGITGRLISGMAYDKDGIVYAGSGGAGGSGVFRTINSATEVKQNNKVIPAEYYLSQNYPNPFNPTTTINYSIPKASVVVLKIYDTLGREITTLVDETKSAGNHNVTFDAHTLTSGVYFYRLQADRFVASEKMILIK